MGKGSGGWEQVGGGGYIFIYDLGFEKLSRKDRKKEKRDEIRAVKSQLHVMAFGIVWFIRHKRVWGLIYYTGLLNTPMCMNTHTHTQDTVDQDKPNRG